MKRKAKRVKVCTCTFTLYLCLHWLQQSKAKNDSVAERHYLPQWKQNSVTNLTEKTKPDGGQAGKQLTKKKKSQAAWPSAVMFLKGLLSLKHLVSNLNKHSGICGVILNKLNLPNILVTYTQKKSLTQHVDFHHHVSDHWCNYSSYTTEIRMQKARHIYSSFAGNTSLRPELLSNT